MLAGYTDGSLQIANGGSFDTAAVELDGDGSTALWEWQVRN